MKPCCGSCKHFYDMLVVLHTPEDPFVVAGACMLKAPPAEIKRRLLYGMGEDSYYQAIKPPCDKYVKL